MMGAAIAAVEQPALPFFQAPDDALAADPQLDAPIEAPLPVPLNNEARVRAFFFGHRMAQLGDDAFLNAIRPHLPPLVAALATVGANRTTRSGHLRWPSASDYRTRDDRFRCPLCGRPDRRRGVDCPPPSLTRRRRPAPAQRGQRCMRVWPPLQCAARWLSTASTVRLGRLASDPKHPSDAISGEISTRWSRSHTSFRVARPLPAIESVSDFRGIIAAAHRLEYIFGE